MQMYVGQTMQLICALMFLLFKFCLHTHLLVRVIITWSQLQNSPVPGSDVLMPCAYKVMLSNMIFNVIGDARACFCSPISAELYAAYYKPLSPPTLAPVTVLQASLVVKCVSRVTAVAWHQGWGCSLLADLRCWHLISQMNPGCPPLLVERNKAGRKRVVRSNKEEFWGSVLNMMILPRHIVSLGHYSCMVHSYIWIFKRNNTILELIELLKSFSLKAF